VRRGRVWRFDRERRAAGQRLERWTQAAAGKQRRVNAAGDLPQVVQHGDQAVGEFSQLNSQL
jgi:hypothetical protein